MRFCKLDWKPDAGHERPRVISGTRVLYEVDDKAVLTDGQHVHLSVVLSLLGREVGLEEGRLDAVIEAGGLEGVLVKAGG